MLIALLLELGSQFWLTTKLGAPESAPRPGIGIASLAALDGLLLLTLVIMALGSMGVSANLLARLNGIAGAILAFFTLLASLGLLFAAIGLLMLMVGLLVAVPFGTAVYMAVFGHFDRGAAAITLGLLMTLKLASAITTILGSQYALKGKLFVLLFACSLLLTWLLTFLHGLPPRFLVSITDDIGAIIAFIVAIIWCIIYLIGGIIAIIGNLQLHVKKRKEAS
jgi:hypothetical protein